MSDRMRIVLIFGVVGAVFGGGGYYLFKTHQRSQDRGTATGEIERWEQRLDKARACLLGPTPGSSKASEALALRELSPEPWDRGACTKLVSSLSRGTAEDTGVPDVELAWRLVDKAASHLASSFVAHIDPSRNAKARAIDPLPGALDALEVAHANLREVAGMPPLPASGVPPLRVAEVIALRDGSDPVTAIDALLTPSANGLYAIGKTKDATVELVLPTGGAPRIGRIRNAVRRSVGDFAWGAASSPTNETVVGPIDRDGAVNPTAHLAPAAPAAGDATDYDTIILYALGNAADGVVVSTHTTELTIARTTATTITPDKPLANTGYAVAIDPVAGRSLLAWSTAPAKDTNTLHGTILRPGAPTKLVELGSGTTGPACLTATKGWASSYGRFIEFDDAGVASHDLPGHELVSCNASGALLRRVGSPSRYSICTATCRTAEVGGTRSNALAALAGDEVVALSIRHPVVVVWREHHAPLFVSIPTPTAISPRVVHATATTIDLLGETDAGAVIVRIPL